MKGNKLHMATHLCLLATALVCFGCEKQEIKTTEFIRPIKAVQIQQPKCLESAWYSGRTRATEEVNLAFRVSGLILKRTVNVGDTVKRGDILAGIDPRDYRAEVDRIRGELVNAQATLERARADYERELRIFRKDPGATSERAVERARQSHESAKGGVQALSAALTRKQNDLEYTSLRAPFSGVIVATYVEPHENVPAGRPIVRLVNSSKIEMVLNIPENEISEFANVKSLDVRLDAFPDLLLNATVKEIGHEASMTTKTFPVTLVMDQPRKGEIYSGMSGEARIAEYDRPGLCRLSPPVLPASCVFSDDRDKNSFVWIVKDDLHLEKRRISIGKITADGIEILKNVVPGEIVAAGGVSLLRENLEVRLGLEGSTVASK